jgi:omega-6 fatty acid desaturase (delta-12 desaturase)
MSTPRPAEVLEAIPPEARRRSYFPDLALLALNYAAFLACLAGAVVLPSWWLKIACAGLAPLLLGGLYVIGHDAGHGAFVPGRLANLWIARLAFLPSLTPLAGWYRAHVLSHHNFLRVRGRDMVWMPWSPEEYRSAPRWRRLWYRFLRTPAGLAFYWTVCNWLPYLLFPRGSEMGERRGQQRFDRTLVLGYVLAVLAGLFLINEAARDWTWAEPAPLFWLPLAGVALPYVVWSYFIAVVDLVQHTHPRAVWFESRKEWDYFTANVRSTTHMLLPFGVGSLVHNILRHTAHHSDPRVPLYNLPAAQASLEAAFQGDVPVERLTPGYVLRVLRTCRLYDSSRRQWLDYDGTPTSEAQRPREGAP